MEEPAESVVVRVTINKPMLAFYSRFYHPRTLTEWSPFYRTLGLHQYQDGSWRFINSPNPATGSSIVTMQFTERNALGVMDRHFFVNGQFDHTATIPVRVLPNGAFACEVQVTLFKERRENPATFEQRTKDMQQSLYEWKEFAEGPYGVA